jgi:hypothetical protein
MRKILVAVICLVIIANMSCKKGKTTTTIPLDLKDYSLVGKYMVTDSTYIIEYGNAGLGVRKESKYETTLILDSIQNSPNSYRTIKVENFDQFPGCGNDKTLLNFYNDGTIKYECYNYIDYFKGTYDTVNGVIHIELTQFFPPPAKYYYYYKKVLDYKKIY